MSQALTGLIVGPLRHETSCRLIAYQFTPTVPITLESALNKTRDMPPKVSLG